MNATPRPIRRALISVYDKTGLVRFAQGLAARGVALISTGGSARTLAEAGLAVSEVATVTGFPEMLDGRVKTLHPAIHGGLLARRDRPGHLAALAEHGIAEIDLLVSNLYPFAATVASGAGREECIENIDIGGVALIRAAAKNHEFVTIITDPADYDLVLAEMAASGGAVGLDTRRRLARQAYALTAAYDAAIASWFARDAGVAFPETLVVTGHLAEQTRYGENPHQAAALYRTDDKRPGVASARQVQGKELSYNNYGDTDAAFELVAEFGPPAVAIIKHANPCGGREPARGLDEGARLRSGQRLWRHRRAQPAARRGDRRSNRANLRRGGHRAGRGAGGVRDPCAPRHAAPPPDRRPPRPACAGLDLALGGRRPLAARTRPRLGRG